MDRVDSSPSRLVAARRVVIKIGSALLVDRATNSLDRPWFEGLVEDIARLRRRGQEVLLVSSGAIALGRRHLGLRAGPLRLEESQAAAAAGQVRLAHAWQEALGRHDIPVAQVLLTLGDTEQRRRYLNARGTLETLLGLGAVPVINENDTVATEEIRYGDNDRLAARVAQMTSADCLVLLSDIAGLYTADPARDPDAWLVPEIHAVTPEIEAMAGESATDVGSGGMITKLMAARISLAAGCNMVIASGRVRHPLQALEEGAPCTWFVAAASPARVRKQWIAGALKPSGELVVDAGAAAALAHGKSLLPAGVVSVSGRFERGDLVLVKDQSGRVLARGLSAYDSAEAGRIIGLRSSMIEQVLGYRGREELVHRNDLAMVNEHG
ncbi:glutamate 5-kinase [Thioalkalivibrio sp. XN8]|uniref:glutamate 5-kinase n=1 Tax=Thioalkalivibrio sp. XN8 TaxID=2712863 RepID=UPI00197E0FAE|nr:glutamate 5-kinase [Thioalkalivibrio sp. XN8]